MRSRARILDAMTDFDDEVMEPSGLTELDGAPMAGFDAASPSEPTRAGGTPGELARDEIAQRASEELSGIEHRLAVIAEVLARLEAGDYGSCATCGSAIEDVVLREDPAANACAVHRA